MFLDTVYFLLANSNNMNKLLIRLNCCIGGKEKIFANSLHK